MARTAESRSAGSGLAERLPTAARGSTAHRSTAAIVLNVARAAEHLGDNLHTLELNPVWVRDPQVEILDALIAVHSAED
jgi:hypothetical protein